MKIDKDKLQLTVNQSPIAEWIQQQLEQKKQKRQIEDKKLSNSHGFKL